MRASIAGCRPIPRAIGLSLAVLVGLAGPPARAFDLQGHRGARGLAPENTLAAFETALRVGVTTLELDLGISRDGALVVSHDPRLDPELTRRPDGTWIEGPGPRLSELDLVALRRFDIGRARPGGRVARRFPDQRPADGETVPTLAEVVALTDRLGADHVRFNIETKVSPLAPDDAPAPEIFARRVVEEVARLGIGARTTVQSFDWRPLEEVHRLAPDLSTACLTAEQTWLDTLEHGRPGASPWLAGHDIDDHPGVPALVHAAGCAIWSPYYEDLDRSALARAHDLGLEVVVWTVNDRRAIPQMLDLGVDGLITDYPDQARAVLEQRGLPLPPKVVPP